MSIEELFCHRTGMFFPAKGSLFLPTTARISRPNAKGKCRPRWWNEAKTAVFLESIKFGGVGPLGQYLESVGRTWAWVAQQMLAQFPDSIPGELSVEHRLEKMTQKCRNYWSDCKKQNSPKASTTYQDMLASAAHASCNGHFVRWGDVHDY